MGMTLSRAWLALVLKSLLFLWNGRWKARGIIALGHLHIAPQAQLSALDFGVALLDSRPC